MIPIPCDGTLRWPCCLSHVDTCTAGCGDPSQKLSTKGKVVGAFCFECHKELVDGEIPDVITRRLPRKPKGASLKDLQDEAWKRRRL